MTAIGQAVSAVLIQFVWQGALVALLLWVFTGVLARRSAQARYIAGCVALAVMALMPVLTAYFFIGPRASLGPWCREAAVCRGTTGLCRCGLQALPCSHAGRSGVWRASACCAAGVLSRRHG